MKFKCSQQELMDTLNTVSRAAATTSTLMVINNIYFEARNNDVYICCYNLEMGITKIISAQVTKTGSAIIPIRLCDIVKKLPGDTVEIECDDKYMVNIRSGYSEYKLIGTSDMKKVKDMKGNPLLLFVNSWSVGMTLDRNPGLELSEFGKNN